MNGKKIISLLAAVFLPAMLAPCAFSQELVELDDVRGFEKRLEETAASIRTIDSRFVQRKYMDVLQKDMVSEGTFRYMAPDKVRMEYETPVQYVMVMNGDSMKTVSGGKENVMSNTGSPMFSQLRRLMTACMTGALGALNDNFKVRFFSGDGEYVLRLEPLDEFMKDYISMIEMHIDMKEMKLVRLRMNEGGTDYTEYLFSDIKYNTLEDEGIFEI